jgi:hypothetical protein
MLAFLVNNWRIVAIVVVGLSLFGEGYHLGAANTQEKWDKTIQEAQTSILIKERFNQAKSFEIGKSYEKTIDAIAIDADRVRKSTGSSLPAVSNSSSKCVTAPKRDKLSTEDREFLIKLAQAAEVQTARLRACQNFINFTLQGVK